MGGGGDSALRVGCLHLGNGLLAGGLWLPAYLTVPRHATPQQHDNDHALHKVAQLVGATGTAATSPPPLPAAAASNPAAAAHPRRLLRPLLLLLQPDERDKGTPDKWIWRHSELIRLTSKLVGGGIAEAAGHCGQPALGGWPVAAAPARAHVTCAMQSLACGGLPGPPSPACLAHPAQPHPAQPCLAPPFPHRRHPLNAEAPLRTLMDRGFITPTSLHCELLWPGQWGWGVRTDRGL